MQNAQIRFGNGKELAEERVHFITIETLSAFQKDLRVGHVRRATRMNEDLKLRILFDDGTGGTRVVEVDVSKKDGMDVGKRKTVKSKLFAKSRERGGWAGVDDSNAIGGTEQGGGDGARMSGPKQIEKRERKQSKRSVNHFRGRRGAGDVGKKGVRGAGGREERLAE
jgi:hypothetical protein